VVTGLPAARAMTTERLVNRLPNPFPPPQAAPAAAPAGALVAGRAANSVSRSRTWASPIASGNASGRRPGREAVADTQITVDVACTRRDRSLQDAGALVDHGNHRRDLGVRLRLPGLGAAARCITPTRSGSPMCATGSRIRRAHRRPAPQPAPLLAQLAAEGRGFGRRLTSLSVVIARASGQSSNHRYFD